MKQFTKTLGIALLGAILAVGILEFKDSFLQEKTTPALVSAVPATGQFTMFNTPEGELPSFTEVAQKAVHAVVHVNTEYQMGGYYDPLAQMLGRPSHEQIARGAGSGVIIGSEGYIVTNNHVIEGADKIYVTTNNNKSYEATIVGTDPATDIALIKIEESNLPVIEFGNSNQAQVGEWVLAVGNPFNLTSTVTAGIISAKSRNINLLRPDQNTFPIESFIQTDAAVNPGNSGGALVNTSGQLIGINTAIASQTGSYAGYSFAVPSRIVQKVTNDIIEFGEVQRALIGVSIQNVNQKIADDLSLEEVNGILVTGLTPNGAANEAGLKEQDVIIGVNGEDVFNVPELQEEVSQYRPGDHILVSVLRNNERIDYEVILRNQAGGTDIYKKEDYDAASILEAKLVELDQYQLRKYRLRSGIQIVDFTGDKLRSLGMKKGFIITHIDRVPVTSSDQVAQLLLNSDDGILLSGIYPNGQKAYYGLGV
jgi:Do/DeqQ family serine protease